MFTDSQMPCFGEGTRSWAKKHEIPTHEHLKVLYSLHLRQCRKFRTASVRQEDFRAFVVSRIGLASNEATAEYSPIHFPPIRAGTIKAALSEDDAPPVLVMKISCSDCCISGF